MSQYQPGILAAPVPLQARHLFFAVDTLAAVPAALDALVQLADTATVVGVGEPLGTALGAGAVIGLLSGLTGVGGGIFLSPLLILMKWADVKQTSAVSAAFILVNSISLSFR